MLFSEHFKVTRTAADDWLDVVMSLDTALFIDPFLIYANEHGEFAGSHDEIIEFFKCVFELIAQAQGDKESVPYKKALACLSFPEVEELCLGFTAAGTRGAGSGKRIARQIAEAIHEAIQAGLKNIDHFEKIAILRERIGPDRVSDIAAALLRSRFVRYTAAVCKKHKVPTEEARFVRGHFNAKEKRWERLVAQMPTNPNNGKAVLLVPTAYLREMPTINVDGFRDYCKEFEAETLRAELNADILSKMPKKEIIALARRHPELLQKYVKKVEATPPVPYDLEKDTRGVQVWYRPTQAFCAGHLLEMEVGTADQLKDFIAAAVAMFKEFIEDHEGWRYLWLKNRNPRDERAAQNLLLGIVKHYCHACGVTAHPEQYIGRDPVTFTKGDVTVKLLLELKLARNRRHWNGLSRSQPAHEKAAKAQGGHVVIVVLNDKDEERAINCRSLVAALKAEYGLRCHSVDGGHYDAEIWKPEPTAVHNGDVITVNGPVTASAVGSGASLEARDVAVGAALLDVGTYEI